MKGLMLPNFIQLEDGSYVELLGEGYKSHGYSKEWVIRHKSELRVALARYKMTGNHQRVYIIQSELNHIDNELRDWDNL